MTPLNLALVGCGIISESHLRAIASFPERIRLIAVCDRDTEKMKTAVSLYQKHLGKSAEVEMISDFDALLTHPDLQAVTLLLPHHLHKSTNIASLRAGKHVLCEKPLAIIPEDIDEMALVAQETGKVLMHGENMRTAKHAEIAAEAIRSGEVGTIVGIQATYAHWQGIELNKSWRTQPEFSGGGHLIDGAIHWIDVMRHLGGDVTGVQAMTTRFRAELGTEVEDTAVVNLRYKAGFFGQLFATHASKGRGASPMMTVFGTEGCLSLEAYGGGESVVLFKPDTPKKVLLAEMHWWDTFVSETEHFLDVVQKGVPLKSTTHDARENLKVVLAAYESAKTGQLVEIE
ncbi:MAG: Gfo/Idh/MocA family oxidoreductase [Chthonomonadaceae bacterium]|nr:Gfo/Idh/MocA family oxidoreductase [Chthonomonadaceae bacterium]